MTAMPPTWTILIPTLGERRALFERLMTALLPQVARYGGRVQVRAWFNNGTPSLPAIRQSMVERASAEGSEYISFVDDDDLVAETYVDEVMSALGQRPDYVGFQVQCYSNGRPTLVAYHSLEHDGWVNLPDRYLRDISHINPIRTSIARTADFRQARPGGAEDRAWVAQLRRGKKLQREIVINQVLYHYLHVSPDQTTGSRWKKPAMIRQRAQRSAITSPEFAWHDNPEGSAMTDEEFEAFIGPPRWSSGATAQMAVVIPTRGRPENIRKVIGAWDFTNAWDVADMTIVVDEDDPEIRGYRDLFEAHRHPDTDDPLFSMMVEPVWRPMVAKLNRAAVALAESRKYFAIGFAGDDHLPRTIDWAKAYLVELIETGSGMVYGDDGYQGKKLSTEWAVTADTVRALGRMVPAPVEHMYCDNSIMEVFDQAGALKHLPGVRIEHLNPYANGKAEMDQQYKRVNSREQYRKDGETYRVWQVRQRPADVATIKSLRPGRPEVRPHQSKEKRVSTRSPFPHHFKQVKGVTPEEIGITLADFAVKVPADQAIVELGVYHGKTTLQMAWGARQGNGAPVTGIDPWDLDGNVYGTEMGDLGGARSWARYWVQALGYSNRVKLVQAFSTDAAGEWVTSDDSDGWGNRPVGLLFVDGDHTYEGARADIEAWAPHLAENAVIAIDDYVNENYPGVAQAVDDLVSEGVLAPVEVFHDRLAVTRLTERVEDGPAKYGATAITSEGVSPSPYPAAPDQIAIDPNGPQMPETWVEPGNMPTREELEAEWRAVDPEGVAALEASAAELDETMSKRETVQPGESEKDNWVGASIETLNLAQLKALARTRGIRLGARKDLRAQILQALRDGK